MSEGSISEGIGSVGGQTYLLVSQFLGDVRLVVENRLHGLEDRHKLQIDSDGMLVTADIEKELARRDARGVIFTLDRGWADRKVLLLSRRLLGKKVKIFFYWPAESAIEVIDRHRWRSHAKLFFAVSLYRLRRGGLPAFQDPEAVNKPLSVENVFDQDRAQFEQGILARINAIRNNAHPFPVEGIRQDDKLGFVVDGVGVYLRTDYWARIKTGGSYGHTCYIAKELAARSKGYVAFMANRFDLMDEQGVRQVVVDRPDAPGVEREMLIGSEVYYQRLRVAMEYIRPAYIYERLVAGNFAGARLSRDLGIPYIIEYNGSEISMMRSFSGRSYDFEYLFLDAERAAFEQATAISVISDAVRDQVLAMGAKPEKVLVNPNGADTVDFRPGTLEEKAAVKRELGWAESDRVIGFVGTFGGWHGIEVLADALKPVCDACPDARFLLIGHGNLHHLVVEAVERHGLGDRVTLTGALDSRRTQKLLRGCDIYISPHHRGMVDSRFFGSPTKLFEYMALGGGIVASELEQIGEVLSPALRVGDLDNPGLQAGNARAILCQPGNLAEFVAAVSGLCKRTKLCEALGRNARAAAETEYSWGHHVERLLAFLASAGLPERSVAVMETERTGPAPVAAGAPLATGDAYKDEVQKQWDNDPCGSHYVGKVSSRLEFFREAERFRHQEYAPWMREVMEFDDHPGESVLEIGAGMGTDLAQFAIAGSIVTDLDLSSGHLRHAQENFQLRGLSGTFRHGDGEFLPFPENSFDVVYSNGVIHHTPNTQQMVSEIHRVLKPGGKAIIMVYRENSIQYWRDIVYWRGIVQGQLNQWSVGEIMSRSVEISETGARPLVKVYSAAKLKAMFSSFRDVSIYRRQLMKHEPPHSLKWLPVSLLQRFIGWNLIVKATNPV